MNIYTAIADVQKRIQDDAGDLNQDENELECEVEVSADLGFTTYSIRTKHSADKRENA